MILICAIKIAPYWQILLAAFLGFLASCVVQLIFLHWKERIDKKLLRKSLYRELAAIYVDLRNLLDLLDMTGPIENEENPANLPEIVKAECFGAAKASPLFWRLSDATGIVHAHACFKLLGVSEPKDMRSAATTVKSVARAFRALVKDQKISRHALLESAGGQITKIDFDL